MFFLGWGLGTYSEVHDGLGRVTVTDTQLHCSEIMELILDGDESEIFFFKDLISFICAQHARSYHQ